MIWEIRISQGSGVGLKVPTVRNKKSVPGGSVSFCLSLPETTHGAKGTS